MDIYHDEKSSHKFFPELKQINTVELENTFSYYKILMEDYVKKLPQRDEFYTTKVEEIYKILYLLKTKYDININIDGKYISNEIIKYINHGEIDNAQKFISSYNISQLMGRKFSYNCPDNTNDDMKMLTKYIEDKKRDENTYFYRVGSKLKFSDNYIFISKFDEDSFNKSHTYFIRVAVGTIVKKLLADNMINKFFSRNTLLGSGIYGDVSLLYSDDHKLKIIEKKTKKGIDQLFTRESSIGKRCLNPLSIFFPTYMYTYAMTKDQNCMYSENINGKLLKDFVSDVGRNNQIDDKEADSIIAEIIYQFICAIHVAQNMCNFVHYDIKADNIIITTLDEPITISYPIIADKLYIAKIRTKYVVKIIDFGIARMVLDVNDATGRPNFIDIGKAEFTDYNIYRDVLLPGTDFVKLIAVLATSSNHIMTELKQWIIDRHPIMNRYQNVSPYTEAAYILPSEVIKHPVFQEYDSIILVERPTIESLLKSWEVPFYGPSGFITDTIDNFKLDIRYYLRLANGASKRTGQFPYMLLFYLLIVKNIQLRIKKDQPKYDEFSDKAHEISARLIEELTRILDYPRTHNTKEIFSDLKKISDTFVFNTTRSWYITTEVIEKYNDLKAQLIDFLMKTISLPDDEKRFYYKQINRIISKFAPMMGCKKISLSNEEVKKQRMISQILGQTTHQ